MSKHLPMPWQVGWLRSQLAEQKPLGQPLSCSLMQRPPAHSASSLHGAPSAPGVIPGMLSAPGALPGATAPLMPPSPRSTASLLFPPTPPCPEEGSPPAHATSPTAAASRIQDTLFFCISKPSNRKEGPRRSHTLCLRAREHPPLNRTNFRNGARVSNLSKQEHRFYLGRMRSPLSPSAFTNALATARDELLDSLPRYRRGGAQRIRPISAIA